MKRLFLVIAVCFIVGAMRFAPCEVAPKPTPTPIPPLEERLATYRKLNATNPSAAFAALQPVDHVQIVDLLARVFMEKGGNYTFATSALRTAKGDDVIARINFHAANSSTDAIRLGFILSLQALLPPSSLDMLLNRVFAEKVDDIQNEIILTLRNFKTAEKTADVFAVLATKAHSDRNSRNAIISLVTHESPRAVELLVSLYNNRKLSPSLKAEALLGLYERKSPELIACVESGINDRDMEVRIVAMFIAGELDFRKFSDKIVSELSSSSWEIRIAAIRACGKLKIVESVPHLLKIWKKEDGKIGEEIHAALLRITGKSFPPYAKVWIAWFENLEEPLSAAEREGEYVSYHGMKTKSKNLCFLVDISGSMSAKAVLPDYAGEGKKQAETTRMELMKAELIRAVSALGKDVYFNVVAFETNVSKWRPSQVQATETTKSEAVSWIRTLQPTGGTELFKGLMEAFGEIEGKNNYVKRPDTIFVLSDGTPNTAPFKNQQEMLAEIARINRVRQITLHTICIGTGGKAFLEPLAAQNGGIFKLIDG